MATFVSVSPLRHAAAPPCATASACVSRASPCSARVLFGAGGRSDHARAVAGRSARQGGVVRAPPCAR
eukprot:6178478-Pleurochrysis_carterae.AAC.1